MLWVGTWRERACLICIIDAPVGSMAWSNTSSTMRDFSTNVKHHQTAGARREEEEKVQASAMNKASCKKKSKTGK